MIQQESVSYPLGGYDGMQNWLKLDPNYVTEHHMDIRDFADFNKLDYDNPYELLWTLLGYSGADSKPWLHPVIDPKAINDLAMDAQMGSDEGRELLVLFLYRLAAKTANRFGWATQRFPMDRADLIHQGIVGIYTALEKWTIDEDKDFAYWAQMHIFSEIQRMVTEDGPTIRLPYHKQILQAKLSKIRSELEQELDRQATYEELAFYIRSEEYDTGITTMLEAPEIAMLEINHVSSLNQIINDDEFDYVEIMDTVPDDGSNLLAGARDYIAEVEYKDLFDALLTNLDDMERFVVLNYNKGYLGNLSGSEVAAELADQELTKKQYSNAAITNIFERACLKMRFAAYDMDLNEDIIFS